MTDPLFPQLHVNLVNQHLFEEIVKRSMKYVLQSSVQLDECSARTKKTSFAMLAGMLVCDYFANLSALKGTRLQVLWDVYHIIIMAIEGPEESQSKYTQEWVK